MDDPAPDPRIVREIAREAMRRAARHRNHIAEVVSEHPVMDEILASGDKTAYGKLREAVEVEQDLALGVVAFWADEQPATAADDEHEAVERVEAAVTLMEETVSKYGLSAVDYQLTLRLRRDPNAQTGEMCLPDLRAALGRLQRLERALVEPDPLMKATLIQGIKPWTGIDDMPTTDLTPEESASFDAALASLREDPQADEIERLRNEVQRLERQRDGLLGHAYASGWCDAIIAYRAPGWTEREAGWKEFCKQFEALNAKGPDLAAGNGREAGA